MESWYHTQERLVAAFSAIHHAVSNGHWQKILSNPSQLLKIFVNENPFVALLIAVLILSFIVFILGLLTKNYSHVDRLWSVVPFIYVYYFLLQPLFSVYINGGDSALHKGKDGFVLLDKRLLVMSIVSALWGIRLTYNFARKGGYNLTHQDYRWPVLMNIISNRFLFEVFNLTFISYYQSILIFLFSAAPAYIAWLNRGTPLNYIDYLATAAFIIFLIIETVADQQQWNFQTQKYKLIDEKKVLTGDYKLGFLRTGLFRYSRHPNFFAEMMIWWAFYLYSVAASGDIFNWSAIGTFLLTLLFQGSTVFTEYITVEKYDEYKRYQETTNALIPWFSKQKQN